ncbi:MAG: hypothetical protein Q7K44_01235 [Candidatus Liptonbacteria bacterium]|nr:hypothetical protein [Candidatus Liptonbacteria bacterium]
MDILSHGLWAGAATKSINLKRRKSLNVWLTAFWGVFPDLFAFTIPFIWLFFNLLSGNINFSDIHRPTGAEPENKLLFGNGNTEQTQSSIAYLTSSLYNISHSLFIFLLIFGLVILIRKLLTFGSESANKAEILFAASEPNEKISRFALFFKKENVVPWEMGGWLLHILLDIPTHSYAFYPTPVFWPLGGWKFSGYPWAHPWFIAANYSAIAVAYLTIRYFRKRKV